MAIRASAELPLEGMAPEGAGASVYVRGDLMRIDAGFLGESVREHMQLMFHKMQLVCSTVTTTSIQTVMARSADNPQGRPPFWRYDLRVFDDGKQVHHLFDAAPAGDQPARDAPATVALATKLGAAAARKLAR